MRERRCLAATLSFAIFSARLIFLSSAASSARGCERYTFTVSQPASEASAIFSSFVRSARIFRDSAMSWLTLLVCHEASAAFAAVSLMDTEVAILYCFFRPSFFHV